jgi:hypothetical protein
MAAHPWRDSAFPRRGRWLRRIFSPVTNTSIIATIIVWIAISPIRADSIKAPSEPVDTEHLFGFVEGADIGNRGERELVIDSLSRVGRSTGSFDNTASELVPPEMW